MVDSGIWAYARGERVGGYVYVDSGGSGQLCVGGGAPGVVAGVVYVFGMFWGVDAEGFGSEGFMAEVAAVGAGYGVGGGFYFE